MISKKHFLAQMEKLMELYDEQVPNSRLMAYYEVLSPDFTDEQFDKALNLALKNSFKFPPVAAFYKVDPSQPEEKKAYDPLSDEEAENIRRVYERHGL